MSDDVERDPLDGPIHLWFGLTYANYLVLPRSILQNLPIPVQERLVAALEDVRACLGEECQRLFDDMNYTVEARSRDGRFRGDAFAHYERGRTKIDLETGRKMRWSESERRWVA